MIWNEKEKDKKERKREINQQQKRKWKKEAILRKEVEEYIKKEKKTFVASLRITYNDTGEQHTIKPRRERRQKKGSRYV